MDAKPPQISSEPLNYKTWILKVSIHCEGCRRKVKKVLKSIDGVFTATIDPQIQKVTVTGNVGVETLLRKLVKAGKHAEIWPENVAGNGKNTGEEKKKKQKNGEAEKQSLENRGSESGANCDSESKSNNSNSKTSDDSPKKSPTGNHVQPEGDGGGKKKKKGQSQGGGNRNNGASAAPANAPAHTGFQLQNIGLGPQMSQLNLNPTRQQSFSYPEAAYHPMVYFAAYNRLYPNPMASIGGPCYYVSSPPYTCAGVEQQYGYQFQSAPLVSFEIFSDDNANGCSIM